MNDFISLFKNCSFQESFGDSLDEIITKLNALNDVDDEWKTLRTNYSRLRYLHELVKKYYIPDSEKFLLTLERFLTKHDVITKYYLDEIDWHDKTYEVSIKIKEYFELSLQTTDCIEKLNVLMKGYSLLVPVVESTRNEKCIENLDRSFVEDFNFKRRKLY